MPLQELVPGTLLTRLLPGALVLLPPQHLFLKRQQPRDAPLFWMRVVPFRVLGTPLVDLFPLRLQWLRPDLRVAPWSVREPLLHRPAPVLRPLLRRRLRPLLSLPVVGGHTPPPQDVPLLGRVVPLLFIVASRLLLERTRVLPAVLVLLLRLLWRPVRPLPPVGHLDRRSIQLWLDQVDTPLTAMLHGPPFRLLFLFTPLGVARGPLKSQGHQS